MSSMLHRVVPWEIQSTNDCVFMLPGKEPARGCFLHHRGSSKGGESSLCSSQADRETGSFLVTGMFVQPLVDTHCWGLSSSKRHDLFGCPYVARLVQAAAIKVKCYVMDCFQTKLPQREAGAECYNRRCLSHLPIGCSRFVMIGRGQR